MKPEGGASCCEATLGERQTQAQNGQGGAHRRQVAPQVTWGTDFRHRFRMKPANLKEIVP